MQKYYKLSTLLLAIACMMGTKIYAFDEIVISEESFNKIHSDEFVNVKKSFAESPSLFQSKDNFKINAFAFEDSREKICLTPGDVIKISEELTFSDWGGSTSSSQVAEEDFTLSNDKIKKTEEEGAKTKSIKFSRIPF